MPFFLNVSRLIIRFTFTKPLFGTLRKLRQPFSIHLQKIRKERENWMNISSWVANSGSPLLAPSKWRPRTIISASEFIGQRLGWLIATRENAIHLSPFWGLSKVIVSEWDSFLDWFLNCVLESLSIGRSARTSVGPSIAHISGDYKNGLFWYSYNLHGRLSCPVWVEYQPLLKTFKKSDVCTI